MIAANEHVETPEGGIAPVQKAHVQQISAPISRFKSSSVSYDRPMCQEASE